MNRILITGGSGLLGINFALKCRDKYEIILALNERQISISKVLATNIALGSVIELKKSIEQYKPDIIIHTAGLTSVEQCEQYPNLAERVNVDLAENVAIAAKECKIKMVHISTDHLYSDGKFLYTEEDDKNPINVYGKTKSIAEQRVLSVSEDNLVIRTNFYGWGPSYRKSFSDAIIESLSKNKKIVLFDDVHYTPILVDSLINCVLDLCNLNQKGIFNVVTSSSISKYDFGLMIASKFKFDESLILKGSLKNNPQLVKRPLNMSLSNKKLELTLGRSLNTVNEDIDQLYEQYLNGLNNEINSI